MKLNWGWRIVIVYSIFAVATLTFVAYAVSTRVNLVRPDYYEASLRHDELQESRLNAIQIGASLQLNRDSIILSAPSMRDPTRVEFQLYRPNEPELDRRVQSGFTHEGQAIVVLPKLRDGVWRISASWVANGKTFEISRRVVSNADSN